MVTVTLPPPSAFDGAADIIHGHLDDDNIIVTELLKKLAATLEPELEGIAPGANSKVVAAIAACAMLAQHVRDGELFGRLFYEAEGKSCLVRH
jgi:hypothetical protein